MIPEYREHFLPPPLSAWVECVWFLRAGPQAPGTPSDRVFPDGCVEMIFQMGGRTRAASVPGAFRPQPSAFLIGPLASPLFLEPVASEPMRTLGVRFRPGAAAVFLPFPVDVLSRGGGEAPIDLVFGGAGRELEDRLAGARSDRGRIALVESFLLRRLAAAPIRSPGLPRSSNRGLGGRDRPVALAVSRMLRARRFPVSRLARDCGWSPRQLERRFRAETGLSPRLLARIIRFQRVFRELGSGARDWVSVALDCGYADQAHLIRDFREFSGETPAAFVRAGPSLAGAFLAPERLERFFEGAGAEG